MKELPVVDGVVLVHGGTCAADIWDEVLPLLPFPAVAVDLPGRGSNPADLASVTLDDCVAAVLAAADAAGFGQIALVGHSLGGVTITETGFRHPDRVRSVIYLGALVPTAELSAARLVTGSDMPQGVMHRMPEEMSKALFGNDLNEEQWASVAARLVDDTISSKAICASATKWYANCGLQTWWTARCRGLTLLMMRCWKPYLLRLEQGFAP